MDKVSRARVDFVNARGEAEDLVRAAVKNPRLRAKALEAVRIAAAKRTIFEALAA